MRAFSATPSVASSAFAFLSLGNSSPSSAFTWSAISRAIASSVLAPAMANSWGLAARRQAPCPSQRVSAAWLAERALGQHDVDALVLVDQLRHMHVGRQAHQHEGLRARQR